MNAGSVPRGLYATDPPHSEPDWKQNEGEQPSSRVQPTGDRNEFLQMSLSDQQEGNNDMATTPAANRTDAAPAQTQKPATALATTAQPQPQIIKPPLPVGFGVVLSGFDEAWRMATAIARSDLAPKDYKDKPENCFIAMQMGAEVGLPPMAALQNIAVINGRPSIWGDSALAIVMVHPAFESHSEYYEGTGENKVAVCEIKRRGSPMHTVRFGVADAKTAGLWKKAGPWTNYPDRMLQLRARGFAMRDKFPDALRGLSIAEEAIDIPPDAYTRHEAAVAAVAAELPADIRRASDTSTEAQTKPAYNDSATIVELQNKTARMQQFTALHEQLYKLDQEEASKHVMGGSAEEETAKIEEMKLVLQRLQEHAKESAKQEKKEAQGNSPKLDFSKR
jgi:hypothetical protein